jgi:vitamin B12 transporter
VHRSLCLSLVTGALLAAGVAPAEEIRDNLVVTASRIPVPLAAAGSSVSVIDREDIEARQAVFAVDLLKDVPGFSVSRSGSVGSQTQVRVRGAEANQVLVLIDGIEANDPAGNDEFAFQDLTSWDIERIEVVRGPQSALWGSDALSGVVNVITREPTAEFAAEGFAEAGAFDTWNVGGRVSGTVLGTRAGLSLSRLDSNGDNSSRTGDEDDGYENTTATLSLAASPTDRLDLDFAGRYTSTDKAFDGVDFVATGLPTDTGDATAVDLGYFRAGGTLRLADDRWTHRLRAAWTTTDTENRNDFGDAGATDADNYGVYYQTSWQFTGPLPDQPGSGVTLALERERQEFGQTGPASPFGDPNQDQSMDNTAAVVELLLAPFPRASVSLSGRYDDNSDFDDVGTFRATTAWTTGGTGTRLHASVGTGQKAPTFIERYGYFPDQFTGNPDLQPEKSTGWEAGVEQSFQAGRASVGVTYFHEDLEDEINGFVLVVPDPDDPASFFYTAENLDGQSRRRGVEVSGQARLGEMLALSGSYTYTDSSQPDAVTGEDSREIRRPRHGASFNADLRPPDRRAGLNLNVTWVGERTDTFFEVTPPYGAPTVELDDYYLVSLAASLRLSRAATVHVRVENLLDEQYEDVYGYNTPGLGAFAGLRLTF